jgi:acetyltransferase-like isoleucine patch superfamily enzyme
MFPATRYEMPLVYARVRGFRAQAAISKTQLPTRSSASVWSSACLFRLGVGYTGLPMAIHPNAAELADIGIDVGHANLLDGPISMESPSNLVGDVYSCEIGAYSGVRCEMIGGLGGTCTIGRYCLIAGGSWIGVGSHPTGWMSVHIFQYRHHWHQYPADHPQSLLGAFVEAPSTTIGSDTWIGANAVVKAGVTIGPGAIVGAGAVVVQDVPPYAVVGGVPAKIIRYRFEDRLIERFLRVRWWEFEHEAVSRLPFNEPARCLDILEERDTSGSIRRRPAAHIKIA